LHNQTSQESPPSKRSVRWGGSNTHPKVCKELNKKRTKRAYKHKMISLNDKNEVTKGLLEEFGPFMNIR